MNLQRMNARKEIDELRNSETKVSPVKLNELHGGNDPLIRC